MTIHKGFISSPSRLLCFFFFFRWNCSLRWLSWLSETYRWHFWSFLRQEMESMFCFISEGRKSNAQCLPSLLAILSSMFSLHWVPRNGRILAGGHLHSHWVWLPRLGACVEPLTSVGLVPRRPQREPTSMTNLANLWLSEQRHIHPGVEVLPGPSWHCCQGSRKLAAM